MIGADKCVKKMIAAFWHAIHVYKLIIYEHIRRILEGIGIIILIVFIESVYDALTHL